MTYHLNFEKLLNYEPGDVGINLEMTLKRSQRSVGLTAKIDTGASCCIFERRHGEQLGVAIEHGMRQLFGTATGQFLAYGHEVTLSVAGFEFDSVVYFASDEQIRRSVLGRFGWLDRMVLGLVDYEGQLYLNFYEGPD
jgi:hypothetical protein